MVSIFPSLFYFFLPFDYFHTKQIPHSPSAIVWYSFPTGWDLLETNINPGHVHLDVHIVIDSSRQDTHPARNTSDVCQFQTWIICRTSKILSLYKVGVWSVKDRAFGISSKRANDIKLCSLKWAPFKGLISYVGALGPMGLYEPIASLWNGGADQLKFPADQLKLHGCVHFTKETCVCGFKMSKKWSIGPIRNDTRPIVAAGRPCMNSIWIIPIFAFISFSRDIIHEEP